MKQRNSFMNKPQVGTGKAGAQEYAIGKKNKAVEAVQQKNAVKVPVYVPELKMTVYVVPGTDMAPIIKKHLEMKEWRNKTIVH